MNDARRTHTRRLSHKIMQLRGRLFNQQSNGAVDLALIKYLWRNPDTLPGAHTAMGFETNLHQRTGRLCTP